MNEDEENYLIVNMTTNTVTSRFPSSRSPMDQIYALIGIIGTFINSTKVLPENAVSNNEP